MFVSKTLLLSATNWSRILHDKFVSQETPAADIDVSYLATLHSALTMRGRQHQRSDTVRILKIHVGPDIQENPYNLLVTKQLARTRGVTPSLSRTLTSAPPATRRLTDRASNNCIICTWPRDGTTVALFSLRE